MKGQQTAVAGRSLGTAIGVDTGGSADSPAPVHARIEANRQILTECPSKFGKMVAKSLSKVWYNLTPFRLYRHRCFQLYTRFAAFFTICVNKQAQLSLIFSMGRHPYYFQWEAILSIFNGKKSLIFSMEKTNLHVIFLQ